MGGWKGIHASVSKVKLFVASRQYHFCFMRYKTEIKSLAINGNVANLYINI
jgi:hypothetical protein